MAHGDEIHHQAVSLVRHFEHMAIRERVRSWLDPEGPTAVLEHGADRNARNQRGKTAAEIGRAHAGIVRLLTKS